MATSPAKQALRQQRREQGLCIHCGDPAVFGQTRCEKCALRDKENRGKIAARKKQTGICLYLGCEKPVEADHSFCRVHRLQQNANARRADQERKASGICVDCELPATNGQRCAEHAKQRADYMKAFREKRIAEGRCARCGREELVAGMTECAACLAACKEYLQKLKLCALNAYGGPVCVGCDETELCVLQIDHIGGGGHAHAKEIGDGNYLRGRSRLYPWLRDNNFPPGFRVLCANCNIRAARGVPLPNPAANVLDPSSYFLASQISSVIEDVSQIEDEDDPFA